MTNVTILMNDRLFIFHIPRNILCNEKPLAVVIVRLYFCAAVRYSPFESFVAFGEVMVVRVWIQNTRHVAFL